MHRGVANLLGPILGVSKELFKGCLVIHSKYFDLTTNLAPSFSKTEDLHRLSLCLLLFI